MRTQSRIPAFGVDLLQDLPWTDVGEEVAEGEDFDQLSIECVNYGRIVAEPGHVVRGFLLRFDTELHAALHENGQIADRHAGAIYWNDNLDMPEIVNHVYLLSDEEVDLIERNSLSLQLEKLRDTHTPESVATLQDDDPVRGVLSLLLERDAVWTTSPTPQRPARDLTGKR